LHPPAVKNNPAKFTDPYRINIEFESIAELKDGQFWGHSSAAVLGIEPLTRL
jgi:hypothetical protein